MEHAALCRRGQTHQGGQEGCAQQRDNAMACAIAAANMHMSFGSKFGQLLWPHSLCLTAATRPWAWQGVSVSSACTDITSSGCCVLTGPVTCAVAGWLLLQITAVKNEALDVAAVVAQYQREVAALKAQLAALSGE